MSELYGVNFGEVNAVKTPEIEIAMRELEKEIEQLFENIKGVESRVDKILTPNLTQPLTGETKAPQMPHSPMYNWLEGIRLKLVTDNGILHSIKNRMEL